MKNKMIASIAAGVVGVGVIGGGVAIANSDAEESAKPKFEQRIEKLESMSDEEIVSKHKERVEKMKEHAEEGKGGELPRNKMRGGHRGPRGMHGQGKMSIEEKIAEMSDEEKQEFLTEHKERLEERQAAIAERIEKIDELLGN